MPRNESADQLKWNTGGTVPNEAPDEAPGVPFWRTKSLAAMSPAEWEALCDGCGRCCLIKLEDDDTGEIAVTRLSCKLLDLGTCRCSDYDNRQSQVPDCVKLTPEHASSLAWLPSTCAYRLIAEGRDLMWWHPLVSGTSETVHAAGISVRGSALPESKIRDGRYLNHIVEWIDPKKRR